MATHFIFLAWRIPWTGTRWAAVHGVAESDMTATNIGLWAFLVAQLVKNPFAMQETLVLLSLSLFS